MLLEVAGLRSGYGKLTVLHDVALSVDRAEVVSLIGPNGAGKSTLMRSIAGTLPATAGSILLDGEPVERMAARDRVLAGIGFVPQERNVFGGLSVDENLQVSAMRFGGDAQERVRAALARFPILAERRLQRAATLSGGERQSLAVSSALVGAPKLLLLDEPTAGLAPMFVEGMVAWVAEIVAAGTSVVWVVEQSPEPILAISTRTYVMEAGQIVLEERSEALLEPGRLEEVLLEDRPAGGEPSPPTGSPRQETKGEAS